MCEYTSFQEIGMGAICKVSHATNHHAYQKEKDKIDIAFHVHIPYLIDCAKSLTKSN